MSEGSPSWNVWVEWLQTQPLAQLEESILQRNLSESKTEQTQRELDALRAEIARRKSAADESRKEFFPRVTFRNLEDAELSAATMQAYGEEMLGRLQNVILVKGLSELGMASAAFIKDGELFTPEAVLADYKARCERAGEMLAAIVSEITRLQTEADGKISEENAAYNAEFQTIISRLKSEGKES